VHSQDIRIVTRQGQFNDGPGAHDVLTAREAVATKQ